MLSHSDGLPAVPDHEQNDQDGPGQFGLPVANTSRIMKDALQSQSGVDVRTSKESQRYMAELAAEFILFLSSEFVPTHCRVSPLGPPMPPT